MAINIQKFVVKYKSLNPLPDKNVVNLELLLSFMNEDSSITLQEMAYMLATVRHECSHTFAPIDEFGKGKGRAYGATCDNGKIFYGRGYVQLTWDYNYKRVGKLIGRDLYNNPELLLHPDVAYEIMTKGMRNGWFTGVNFGKYTKNGILNYVSARRIINGQDCAQRIAGYARQFEELLNAYKH